MADQSTEQFSMERWIADFRNDFDNLINSHLKASNLNLPDDVIQAYSNSFAELYSIGSSVDSLRLYLNKLESDQRNIFLFNAQQFLKDPHAPIFKNFTVGEINWIRKYAEFHNRLNNFINNSSLYVCFDFIDQICAVVNNCSDDSRGSLIDKVNMGLNEVFASKIGKIFSLAGLDQEKPAIKHKTQEMAVYNLGLINKDQIVNELIRAANFFDVNVNTTEIGRAIGIQPELLPSGTRDLLSYYFEIKSLSDLPDEQRAFRAKELYTDISKKYIFNKSGKRILFNAVNHLDNQQGGEQIKDLILEFIVENNTLLDITSYDKNDFVKLIRNLYYESRRIDTNDQGYYTSFLSDLCQHLISTFRTIDIYEILAEIKDEHVIGNFFMDFYTEKLTIVGLKDTLYSLVKTSEPMLLKCYVFAAQKFIASLNLSNFKIDKYSDDDESDVAIALYYIISSFNIEPKVRHRLIADLLPIIDPTVAKGILTREVERMGVDEEINLLKSIHELFIQVDKERTKEDKLLRLMFAEDAFFEAPLINLEEKNEELLHGINYNYNYLIPTGGVHLDVKQEKNTEATRYNIPLSDIYLYPHVEGFSINLIDIEGHTVNVILTREGEVQIKDLATSGYRTLSQSNLVDWIKYVLYRRISYVIGVNTNVIEDSMKPVGGEHASRYLNDALPHYVWFYQRITREMIHPEDRALPEAKKVLDHIKKHWDHLKTLTSDEHIERRELLRDYYGIDLDDEQARRSVPFSNQNEKHPIKHPISLAYALLIKDEDLDPDLESSYVRGLDGKPLIFRKCTIRYPLVTDSPIEKVFQDIANASLKRNYQES